MHDASSGRNTKRKALVAVAGGFHAVGGGKRKEKRTDSCRAQRKKKQYKEKEKTYAQ